MTIKYNRDVSKHIVPISRKSEKAVKQYALYVTIVTLSYLVSTVHM